MAESYIDQNEILLEAQDPLSNETLSVSRAPRSLKSAELFNLYNKKPLLVLVDSGSASASELLPGSLRAHNRVVVVGTRTFGKGTIQNGFDSLGPVGLGNIDGVVLFKTIARFHFADKTSNQLVGIQPDFEVYGTPSPEEDDKAAPREADLYSNAVPAAEPTKGIEKTYRKKISRCVRHTSHIKNQFKRDEATALGGDYQLITATAVASCL